jgi:hypothetical protein
MELLREVVAEKGSDYVDETQSTRGCVYTHEGKPSCLIGHVLHRFGYSVENLHGFDMRGEYIGSNGIHEIIKDRLVPADDVALKTLRAAQEEQDDGMPWGDALAEAESVFRREVAE